MLTRETASRACLFLGGVHLAIGLALLVGTQNVFVALLGMALYIAGSAFLTGGLVARPAQPKPPTVTG